MCCKSSETRWQIQLSNSKSCWFQLKADLTHFEVKAWLKKKESYYIQTMQIKSFASHKEQNTKSNRKIGMNIVPEERTATFWSKYNLCET